ncbi:MAG: hypothetical protein JXR51_01915 [Bacteroidales bacterium]|nr:hypothetical protein [Bacteroidales bacterium]
MKTNKFTYIVLFLILKTSIFAQEPIISAGLWNLTNLNGDINFSTYYRGNETTFNQFNEFNESTYFLGGISLKTKSYFWDPKFMILDLNVEYSPETKTDQYLAIPNRSEMRTLKKLDISTTFFKNKNINLNAFANFNQSINNREMPTNIISNYNRFGGRMSYKNDILPFSVSYAQNSWEQEEVTTVRVFKMDQKNLLAKASKSFTDFDFNELNYSHDIYIRQDADLLPIENNIDNLSLKNNFYFDTKKEYNFRSIITNFNQEGNNKLQRFQVNELLSMKLPLKLTFLANYQFNSTHQETQKLNQNRIKASIRHKLFLSLKTNIYYEYYKLNHSVYDEYNNKAGLDINYTKKIHTGRFSFSYKYYRHHQTMNAQDNFVSELNEEHVLSNGQIEILNRQNIDPSTIIVKDISSTIIYQLDFDYIIIERNGFIEIQRIPGGQIQNNETVYIDYTAMQIGSYQYDANNNSFHANIVLFGRLLELYFHTSKQDYVNFINIEDITLNKYTQTLIGSKLDFGFARIGVEYDNYNSNIIPYQMVRYYANFQKIFFKKLICSLNGNIRNYEKTVDKIPQQYTDVTGKIAYNHRLRTGISFEMGYRNQQGDGIDLDLITGRGEFKTSYRQMTFEIGIDVYRRTRLGDKINFNSVYGKIIRKFKL